MTFTSFVPALIEARVGQAICLNLPQRQAPPQATPRPHPTTWHLGSRGVWKERRIKTQSA